MWPRLLGHDHRVAKGKRQHDINQKEDSAAIFGRQVREPPDIAQSQFDAPAAESTKPSLPEKLLLFSFFIFPTSSRLFRTRPQV